jgi:hypothetical protein
MMGQVIINAPATHWARAAAYAVAAARGTDAPRNTEIKPRICENADNKSAYSENHPCFDLTEDKITSTVIKPLH